MECTQRHVSWGEWREGEKSLRSETNNVMGFNWIQPEFKFNFTNIYQHLASLPSFLPSLAAIKLIQALPESLPGYAADNIYDPTRLFDVILPGAVVVVLLLHLQTGLLKCGGPRRLRGPRTFKTIIPVATYSVGVWVLVSGKRFIEAKAEGELQ